MVKKRIGIGFVVMGAVLLTAALLLFLHNEREDRLAGQASQAALAQMQRYLQESPLAPETIPGETQLPGETGPAEETTAPPSELTVVTIDGSDYIGYLSIPEYDLELPIQADWSMDKLRVSPCLQYGSPLTDDAVIAAHNFKQHFLPLHSIAVGENLSFTDMNGNTIHYQVVEWKVIDPTSVYEVIDSDYDLILYTCTIGGQSRVTVRCNRVEHIPQPLADPTPES